MTKKEKLEKELKELLENRALGSTGDGRAAQAYQSMISKTKRELDAVSEEGEKNMNSSKEETKIHSEKNAMSLLEEAGLSLKQHYKNRNIHAAADFPGKSGLQDWNEGRKHLEEKFVKLGGDLERFNKNMLEKEASPLKIVKKTKKMSSFEGMKKDLEGVKLGEKISTLGGARIKDKGQSPKKERNGIHM